MTYFADGTEYTYHSEFEDGSVNIGWLDAAHRYPAGDVPEKFVERLTELCRQPVNLTRGWHYCNLCPRPSNTDLGEPITVPTAEGAHPVGHGEIRVSDSHGTRYAAPDMVIHYVLVHRYRPPEAFIEAVLSA